jgi:lysophospholipase L1-like esterase
MRKLADAYGAIAKNLALRHSVRLVDIQAEMDRALKTLDYRALAEDRVHPTPLGHSIIAQAILSEIRNAV